MESSATVDTLVFQLEDEDPSVRWDTLQRLRKRAAVERAQLPVRNPRRFLHCLRRRLNDQDPRIARETLLLLADVVDVLRDDLDQVFSSVLPHLVPRLSSVRATTDGVLEVTVHEETVAVFRKYVNASNDLAGAANLLVDAGLGHANADVREAALLALIRLLEERYGRRNGQSRKVGSRVDTKLFTELVQAVVPALEDSDEGVVVAAEEAIAKIKVFWGVTGFQEVMAHLSKEDKATLQAHETTIGEFAVAASSEAGVGSILSASQVMKLRVSLPVTPSAVGTPTTLRFGFVPVEVIEAVTSNTGNSNAEWKKRTAAVEQLYVAVKQVDGQVLLAASQDEIGDPIMGLIEMLLRLLQDIDVHLVKRSLQILRLLFYKLEYAENVEDSKECLGRLVKRVMPTLVESAANYADDQEITTHSYTLFQTIFAGGILSLRTLTDSLLDSLQHRRLQVREEGLRIWIILLLTAQLQTNSRIDVLHEKVIDALGYVLGDGSSRVRQMALELVAVLASLANQDVCATLEKRLDEFTLERVDLNALYARIRDKRLPTLLENGQLKLVDMNEMAEVKASTKRAHTRSPDRVSVCRNELAIHSTLRGRSDLLELGGSIRDGEEVTSNQIRANRIDREEGRTCADMVNRKSSPGESADSLHTSSNPPCREREVNSAPSDLIANKLEAIKRKTDCMKKSSSSKQVIPLPSNKHFNPQEGDYDFASAGYAAQQTPQIYESPKAVRLPNDRPQLVPFEDIENESVQLMPLRSGPGEHERTDLSPLSPDDRPIRPMKAINFDELQPSETNLAVRKRSTPISLATKKRMESKQRIENSLDENVEMPQLEPSRETAPAPTRPISLATRKRIEARVKSEDELVENIDKSTKRDFVAGVLDQRGRQEPRYLETHELHPLRDPKQDVAKLVTQLRSDDWEVSFEAMNIVRRLATHHPKLLEDKVRPVITEILKQVPNLRSSVSKNAMLALDSLCNAYGKLLDGEVDNIVPILMKRCTDSNAFVCESTSLSITAVILNCSTGRVVNAIASHLTSRAVPIRREVARSMHSVIVGLADQVHNCKELAIIMNVVGKCLEDSNNEVRDSAKQSVIYLFEEQGMGTDRLKKMLPSTVHTKLESLCTRQSTGPSRLALPKSAIASTQPGPNLKVPATKGAGTRRAPVVDPDALAALMKKLESGNWKDRFDAISEVVDFITKHNTSLCESGKIVSLFDPFVKCLDDGNTKVSTLALEQLTPLIATMGVSSELVLLTILPALCKALAASNPKQASLAQAAMQMLCTHADARLMCQHITVAARNANSRVKPTLLDMLDQLAARKDDRNQSALTRYVLPLSLELLKEGKIEVKDVNARLLRSLYASLGQGMLSSSAKLSAPQHDKLMAILGVQ